MMLDRLDRAGGTLAVLRYNTPDFAVLSPGTHVLCAVTGERIELEELKYWSVERQEAYIDVIASTKASLPGR